MKKVIRYGVFESNSSSMHTVSFRAKSYIPKDKYSDEINQHIQEHDGYIATTLDEYGWNGPSLCDFWEKLKYALLIVLYTEYRGFEYYKDNFYIDQEELEKCKGYQDIVDVINYNFSWCKGIKIARLDGFYPYGYIDHQSYEDYSSLNNFVNDWYVDLEHFLFDDSVHVLIDNDNG